MIVYSNVEGLENLIRQGWKDVEISKHLGVVPSTVSKYRRAMGLPSSRSEGFNARRACITGDRLFDKAIGEGRFEDHPRLRPSVSLAKATPHSSGHSMSMSGCAAAMCAG